MSKNYSIIIMETITTKIAKTFKVSDMYKVVTMNPDFKGGNRYVSDSKNINLSDVAFRDDMFKYSDIYVLKDNLVIWYADLEKPIEKIFASDNKIGIKCNQFSPLCNDFIYIEDNSTHEVLNALFESLRFARPEEEYIICDSTIIKKK